MKRPGPERVAQVLAGSVPAGARLIRDLDDQVPEAIDEIKALYPHTGRAYVVGITGNPGSGKSTVVDALIAHYRARELTVGVLAVDPTSPFSGGAILGDRVRMQRHATDPGVFIRSLATRGNLGGLSRSTYDAIAVMDAMGYDIVLVETVGVGQDEVDVVSTAHTSCVVVVPGLGDEIQAIKAGILEIADVLVVNKADREGADRTEADLRMMLHVSGDRGQPEVAIVRTVATRGQGITELAAAAEAHRDALADTPAGAARARQRAVLRLTALLRTRALDRALAAIEAGSGLERLAQRIVERQLDPYSAADEVLAEILR